MDGTVFTTADSNVSNDVNDAINSTDVEEVYDNTNPRLVNGVIVLLLLLLNVMGNVVVCYIYRFKVKKSVFSFFVTILACLDLITGLTTMLMDVIMKMRPLDETVLNLSVLCKMTHFQVYATSLISGCVLTLIAYQRYRKICLPLKKSMKKSTARFILVIMVLVCILLSVCTLVINGPHQIKIQVRSHIVRVTICRYDDQFKGTALQLAFSYMLLSAFVLVLALTIAFYVMVSRALRQFERNNTRRRSAHSPTCASPNIAALNQEQGFREHSSDRQRKQYQEQFSQARMSVMSMGGGNDRVSTQMYKVFTIITAVFVVSYLPHLVVLILTKTYDWDSKVLTSGQRFILELAYNCPYISTVANPIVYGFRSAEFREHCRHMLTCQRWRQRRSYFR